jgi:hypothetical protein
LIFTPTRESWFNLPYNKEVTTIFNANCCSLPAAVQNADNELLRLRVPVPESELSLSPEASG